MKKIKTMLTVIAAFAVIGGALAFKATKSVHSIWTYHSGLNECIFVAGLKNITASTLDGGSWSSFTSATSYFPENAASCDTTIYYTNEE